MRLPKSVKIGGHDVAILEVDLEDNFGKYDRVNLTIEIRKDASPSQKAATLLHEMLHAIWGESDLTKKYSNDGEEAVVTTLESGLYSAMINNPKVFKYIMESGGAAT